MFIIFVNDVTMTHPIKWVITELQVEKGIR